MKHQKSSIDTMAECIMIDTMGLRVENVKGLKLPRAFARIGDDPDATNESSWAKGNLKSESGKHMPLRVRSQKSGSRLLVEGSNSMQYVGHNIVSSNDAVMTTFSMLEAVHRQYPLPFDYVRRPMAFRLGETVEVTRIDTPAMLQLPAGVNAGAMLNALALAGIRAGKATSIYPQESMYFNQHSQMASIKTYCKALEVKRKKREQLVASTPNTPELFKLAEASLRFEAVFRLKELKRLFKDQPVSPSMLSPKTLAAMFMNLLDSYELEGSMRRPLSKDELWLIRPPYRSTVALWQHGMDLETLFKGDEPRLKSHRRVLKKEHNIDIFLPPPGAIEVPLQLGEILRVENFIPVPLTIKSDPALFYQRDMHSEWNAHSRDLGQRGVGALYVAPFQSDNEVDDGDGAQDD